MSAIDEKREREIRADEAEACAKMLIEHVKLYTQMGSRSEDFKFALENACGSIRLQEHERFRAKKD